MKYQSVSVITKVNDWTWRHSLPVPLSRKEWNCRRMKETNISEMDNIFAFASHSHYTLTSDFCLSQKLMLAIIIFVLYFHFVNNNFKMQYNTRSMLPCFKEENSFDYLIFLFVYSWFVMKLDFSIQYINKTSWSYYFLRMTKKRTRRN